MSYTYLLEQGEESSAECFSNIPASVLSRLNLTAEKSCSNGNEMESFQSSQSGTMCEHSMESRGAGKLMSFAGAAHAPESVQHAQTILQLDGLELMEEGVSFFLKCSELLEKFNQSFVGGKTLRQSPIKDLKRSSRDLTRWGITRDGECLAFDASVRIMSEPECSLLPTPTAHNSKEGNYAAEHRRNTKTLAASIGGKINPEWNEWRMGFPSKWTDLKPLEMPKFQQWLDSHGIHSAKD